jgi:hypothetical protein
MTDGEALLNHWHDRIAGKTTTGGSRKARAAAQPSSAEAQKKRSVRHSESSKLWSALLELVDVNAQVITPLLEPGATCMHSCSCREGSPLDCTWRSMQLCCR